VGVSKDFYTKTDYYYTQGMFLELVHTGIKRFILPKLLWKPAGSKIKNGIA
jgi:hypothetical protein